MQADASRLMAAPGAIFIVASTLLFVPAACTKAATLPQLFPALTDLPAATTVAIEIGWMGLSPLSPTEATYLLELRNGQFEAKGHFRLATASATRAVTVSREAMQGFLAAVIKVDVVEKEYVPRITHTDDYPSTSVGVPTAQGQLIVETRSQGERSASGTYVDQSPWAIHYSGRTFVVPAGNLDEAFAPLEPQLQFNDVFEQLEKQIR
jgi:hypothetical protein